MPQDGTFHGGKDRFAKLTIALLLSLVGLVTGLVIIYVWLALIFPAKWMQSIYKHNIHQIYHQNFEVYLLRKQIRLAEGRGGGGNQCCSIGRSPQQFLHLEKNRLGFRSCKLASRWHDMTTRISHHHPSGVEKCTLKSQQNQVCMTTRLQNFGNRPGEFYVC